MSNSLPLMIRAAGVTASNPLPTLISISPSQVLAGSGGFALAVTGSGFLPSSTVLWNGNALSTTYNSATSLTAQIPTGLVANAGASNITVANPAPGGGTSNALPLQVTAQVSGSLAQITIGVLANDLAWDPLHGRIYLSLPNQLSVPNQNGSNINSVQSLDPVTGALETPVNVGNDPNMLSVSSTEKYLYVGLDGSAQVARLNLPSLTQDVTVDLGGDPFFGPYRAMDLQAAPNGEDTTFAVTLNPKQLPESSREVQIFDGTVARPNPSCPIQGVNCTLATAFAFDWVQWKEDGTELFVANTENTGADLYVLPVAASGITPGVDYGYTLPVFGGPIHYDTVTKLVYDDSGGVVDPATGKQSGSFNANTLMVPDGALGKAFFLFLTGDVFNGDFTVASYDITTKALIGKVQLTGIVGVPTHLIRWGKNGLAFTTLGTSESTLLPVGAVYVLSGDFVDQ